jgi:hypothetical protein
MAGFAIFNLGNTAVKKEPGRERRISDRYPMGDAKGTFIYSGEKNTCNVIDISLDGCLVRTQECFPHGALAYVELDLHVYGLILHIGGITQWARKEHLIGVRFIHPTMRAKNELAGLLTCLVDSDAVEDIKEAIAEAHTDRILSPILSAEYPLVKKPKQKPEPEKQEATPVEPPKPAFIPEAPVPVQPAPILKIEQPEPENEPDEPSEDLVDWSADLHFLKDGSRLHGTVVNLGRKGVAFRWPTPMRATIPAALKWSSKCAACPSAWAA